jgi:hypothetical protein
MINIDEIKPDMPVICSDGDQFATVDNMEESSTIKLKQDETGQHHYISVSWVTSIEEGQVRIDRPIHQAMQEWSSVSPNYIVD